MGFVANTLILCYGNFNHLERVVTVLKQLLPGNV